MSPPLKLLSTDFDGTLFAEFEKPPVPLRLERRLGELQRQGVRWVINTGRDMSNLMESVARGHLSILPDYLVLVEREIYLHQGAQYVPLTEWNQACHQTHRALFDRIRRDIPGITAWINGRFRATIYDDAYSPFCLIADNAGDADRIVAYLEDFCRTVPGLTVVRNDVYARFGHVSFSKGTALGEIARRLSISPESVLAAGDHYNDLPMLSARFARCLVAPANAIEPVKAAVRGQGGFVSERRWGLGVLDGLEHYLNHRAPAPNSGGS